METTDINVSNISDVNTSNNNRGIGVRMGTIYFFLGILNIVIFTLVLVILYNINQFDNSTLNNSNLTIAKSYSTFCFWGIIAQFIFWGILILFAIVSAFLN
jgi:hypothetical protein